MIAYRVEPDALKWGKLDPGGKLQWSHEILWADVFPAGHQRDAFCWKADGDILICSVNTKSAPDEILVATFGGQNGKLTDVASIPLSAYSSFANQQSLRANKIIQTNDNGLLMIASTSEPPFVSMVKLDRRMQTGWIGEINLVGDLVADAVYRSDGSIVLLSTQGRMMIFRPKF